MEKVQKHNTESPAFSIAPVFFSTNFSNRKILEDNQRQPSTNFSNRKILEDNQRQPSTNFSNRNLTEII